ncbi:CehA/McbA family metallohydrolase [Actinomadura harenae]|uniref:PHP domain-containing protein n=1 Tax=Actinomadura harenae TaxID=2483351 RepID=A0A3M2LVF5_9ACTN|nr:CehA/McbA family metallohydrolase [Actinomadura harenae]RMI41076.1 PHP domain-containing protein [Actinomadura harenae]
MIRFEGVWTLEDRLERIMREVPFEVPPGTAALTVRLGFTGGVIDLGCGGPDGFRGWSGGARDTYTIAADWATPGYLPGELEPGEWHVWLRLHRIPPDGTPYEVTVTLHDRAPERPETPVPPAVTDRPARRDGLPEPSGTRWLAGDLHAHTVHSDGTLTVPELAGLAVRQGLDFLAVTDHNTVSHHPELPGVSKHAGIVLVPGQEVTTDYGHANVFGDVGWIDFRRPAAEWDPGDGGVLSINHPLSGDCAWRHDVPPGARPRHVELWHSSWWDRTWGAPLAWAALWRDDTVALGGSDFHDPSQHKTLGEPTTWVLAEDDSPEAVVAAIAAGRTAVTPGPRGGPILLRLGDELHALDADGTVLCGPDGRRAAVRGDRVTLPALGTGTHRLETDRNEVIALCG